MCQMNLFLQNNEQQEKILENISALEMRPEGILVSTLFEEPKLLKNTKLVKIDFLGGQTTLTTKAKGSK